MKPTEYTRVIPRDLFNEAKLLKCFGRLCLMILDNMVPVKMESEHDGEAFNVVLLEEGSLTISNIAIKIKDIEFLFKTTYNSKASYPMYLEHDYCDYLVFNENGEFSEEFLQFAETI